MRPRVESLRSQEVEAHAEAPADARRPAGSLEADLGAAGVPLGAIRRSGAVKIVNDALTRSLCTPGKCRGCGKSVRMRCGAHIWAKGHGGGRQIDIPCNLVQLGMDAYMDCPCHVKNHAGQKPTHDDLLAFSAADNNALPHEIKSLVMLIQRMPPIREVTRRKFIEICERELDLGARDLAMRELKSFEHLLMEEL